MNRGRGIDLALELAKMPSLARAMRDQPLPTDIIEVIRIAAGCQETTKLAARRTGRRVEHLREAAVLYLQQVLFSEGSDFYRVLGVQPGASKKQMREHMKWLMEWLHPDRNHGEWESVFATRVLDAWKQASGISETGRGKVVLLSDPARQQPIRRGPKQSLRPVQRWVALPLEPEPGRKWLKPLALGTALAAAMLLAGLSSLSGHSSLTTALPGLFQGSTTALAHEEGPTAGGD